MNNWSEKIWISFAPFGEFEFRFLKCTSCFISRRWEDAIGGGDAIESGTNGYQSYFKASLNSCQQQYKIKTNEGHLQG